ncbi:MAG: hypothetical protein ACFHXK_03185 [bacterium]
MFKKTLVVACLMVWPLGLVAADANSTKSLQTAAAIKSARLVMDDFMTHFNARDPARWADTLLFPHVRIASGGVIVTPGKAEFVANMDFAAFAETFNWSHSAWDSIDVIQAGPDKVHFKVQFSRFNTAGERYVTYDSLYIVQRDGDRWGIRARSSFAP